MENKKYRNTIIAVMLACILTMAIGYAVLQQRLNIAGTARVDSVWDVRIIDISSSVSGAASDVFVPDFTPTTATFSANLVSPGDSITYDVVVKNNGTLAAEINDIILTNSTNPAIEFTYTGIQEGDTLLPTEEDHVYVTVKYSDSVTSQPESVNANFSIVFDYQQFFGNG